VLLEQDLPEADNLPVQHLVATLKSTTASYKFYWFLAILDAVRQDVPSPIPFDYLLSHMVALAWYPSNYFRLSFGKADQLARCVAVLKSESGLPTNEKMEKIAATALRVLADGSGSAAYADLKARAKYVPYRFLAPWFSDETSGFSDSEFNKKVAALAAENFQRHESLPLYRFSSTSREIEIQPRWRGYLRRHLAILQSFVDWHLVQYVQKLNPNVPGIPNKLFAPERRNLALAKSFWSVVGPTQCIYTGQMIQSDGADLDHFLPWSFVAHDLLWNIIPVDSNANRAKSDSLPSLQKYLLPFATKQYAPLHKVSHMRSEKTTKLIEDYQILVTGQEGLDILETDELTFTRILERTIKPQYEIAANMGFQPNWSYN
jgi:5-methylcytosine-specific restriction endonuclease McrA